MVLEPNFRRYQEPLEASVALMAADDSVDESGMSDVALNAAVVLSTYRIRYTTSHLRYTYHLSLGSLTLIIALAHSHYRASLNTYAHTFTHSHSHRLFPITANVCVGATTCTT